MAATQKIVVYVTPNTRAVNIRMAAKGSALRLNFAGYGVNLTQQPLPPADSQKAYVTSILQSVINNLPD